MTQSVRISTDIDLAAEVLLAGGLVGMPTETVYGLAALAVSEEAVKKVFDTKGRPYNHPLIIHVSSIDEALKWGTFDDNAIKLGIAFWPGPLTLLLPRTPQVPDWVTGGRNTVAIRIPDHEMTLEFLRRVNSGVVAPSANKFGKVSPTTPQHVIDDLGDSVDLVLDGGSCTIGVESTIVECIDAHTQILRHGAVIQHDIEQLLGHSIAGPHGESRAPGMLESHYAPDAQVTLFASQLDANSASIKLKSDGINSCVLFYEDPSVYAQRLYKDLRQADIDGMKVVCAVLPAAGGLGDAVRERLIKAAAR
jgi:L-threonylcarbamoyladenylate synthase